jgi:hypothetical protein
MSELERQSFERTLAVHSAPTLLGIKCANLISVAMDEHNMHDYQQEFENRSGEFGKPIDKFSEYSDISLVEFFAALDTMQSFGRVEHTAGVTAHALLLHFGLVRRLVWLTVRRLVGLSIWRLVGLSIWLLIGLTVLLIGILSVVVWRHLTGLILHNEADDKTDDAEKETCKKP